MYSDIIKNLNKDKVPVLVAAHNVGALGVISVSYTHLTLPTTPYV